MIRIAALLAAALLAAGTASAQIPSQKIYETGKKLEKPMVMTPFVEFSHARRMPDVALETLDGKPAKLPLAGGRVLIVNVWATWCEPCLREIPVLTGLQEKYRDGRIEILGVSVDEDRSKLVSFMKKHGLEKFRTLSDAKFAVEAVMPLTTVPTNFVVDGGGNMIGYIPGYLPWNDKDVEPFLEKLADKYAGRSPDGSIAGK